MSNQHKLAQLQSVKQNLLKQFQEEAVFSPEKLDKLQQTASDSHNRTELIMCYGSRDMALQLQEKLSTGYTYVDHQAAALQLQNGNIYLQLCRPEDVVASELAELEIRVKEQYLASIEAAKAKCIPNIASINIQIKSLEKIITAEVRSEAELAKEIAKVERELIGTEDVVTGAING